MIDIGESTAWLRPAWTLRHPRAGTNLVKAGDELWIVGGRSIRNHFAEWSANGFCQYRQRPNPEVICPETGEVLYTGIRTGLDFMNSTAFRLGGGDPYIYLSAGSRLARIHTGDRLLEHLPDRPVPGPPEQSMAFNVSINGKPSILAVSDWNLYRFDPDTLRYSRPDTLPSRLPAGLPGAAEAGGNLYLFGGNAARDTMGGTGAWVLDLAGGQREFAPLPPLPIALSRPQCVAMDNLIYLIGGTAAGDISPVVLAYDINRMEYTRKQDLPLSCYCHTALRWDDENILLHTGYSMDMGERTGFRTYYPHLLFYKPSADRKHVAVGGKPWAKAKSLNVILSFCDADSLAGMSQKRSVTWQADSDQYSGTLHYRKRGDALFLRAEAAGNAYDAGIYRAYAFRAEMENLEPGSEYEYYVENTGDKSRRSPPYRFRTIPAEPGRVAALLFGDSKSGYEVCNEIAFGALGRMERWQAEGLPVIGVGLGDFGAYGSYDEYQAWFNYAASPDRLGTRLMAASYPFLMAHGNHENLRDTYFNLSNMPRRAMRGWPGLNNRGFEQRWFSFNYGPVHCIELTLGPYTEQTWYENQRLWLEQDLAQAAGLRADGQLGWIVIIAHHSFLTTGEHFINIGECGQYFREGGGSYMDLIEHHGVDVVFSSHDHNYERSHSVKGYRWLRDAGNGHPGYRAGPDASLVAAPPFGGVEARRGTVYIVTGGAGAGQRTMYPAGQVGDGSWIAFRKTDPDAGESVEFCPVYHYLTLEATDKTLSVTAVEKDLSFLPGIIDDAADGVIDRIDIHI